MSDKNKTINDLKNEIAKFVRARDWEQFHSPKNLSMAIAIEAAELMEHFQWHDEGESKQFIKKKKEDIENEVADILAFILSFANLYKIDLSTVVVRKMKLNIKKYPAKIVKGKAQKYTEYKVSTD